MLKMNEMNLLWWEVLKNNLIYISTYTVAL